MDPRYISHDSIQAFDSRAVSVLPPLDIVILNAGRSRADFGLVLGTGHEEMLQVNYLSTVLFATLLLLILKVKVSTWNTN